MPQGDAWRWFRQVKVSIWWMDKHKARWKLVKFKFFKRECGHNDLNLAVEYAKKLLLLRCAGD